MGAPSWTGTHYLHFFFFFYHVYVRVNTIAAQNHMMLGKPDPVQDDPCGPDDVLLLQADTDEAQLGVMWGDVGRFYFTVRDCVLSLPKG